MKTNASSRRKYMMEGGRMRPRGLGTLHRALAFTLVAMLVAARGDSGGSDGTAKQRLFNKLLISLEAVRVLIPHT